MRTRTMRLASAALAGGTILGLAGCAGQQLGKEPGTIDPGGAESAQAEPAGADETEEPAETEIPEATEKSTPDPGSRENPFSIGESVGNDDWTIVLGEPYEAWDKVRAENQFNDPPADGMEFWMLPVTVTYTGTETGDPFWDTEFGFVSDQGRSYDEDCGVIPDELYDVGEMYPDAEASANVCLEVPEGAPGLWTVAARFGDPVFFTAEGR